MRPSWLVNTNQGTGSPDVTVALNGEPATFSAGTLSPATDVALTNALATFSAGSLTATPTLALTNALISSSAGTLAPSTAVSLANALASFSAGTLTPVLSLALSNALASFSSGSLTPSTAVALSNALANWSTGTITVQGDVTVALTGAQANWFAGNMTASGADTAVNVVVGGSGKTKYHWEVEQERQERENVQPQASFANVEQNVFLENPSLLAARVELEKARRELETRRNIEKAKGLRKSLKRQGTEPVFADRQAEEAKKLDEEAMLLILLADD